MNQVRSTYLFYSATICCCLKNCTLHCYQITWSPYTQDHTVQRPISCTREGKWVFTTTFNQLLLRQVTLNF